MQLVDAAVSALGRAVVTAARGVVLPETGLRVTEQTEPNTDRPDHDPVDTPIH